MTDISNAEEAQKKIEELKSEAYARLREASEIADIWGVTYNWDLSYGMGGTYYPQHNENSKWDEDDNDIWRPSDTDDGWFSSSQGC